VLVLVVPVPVLALALALVGERLSARPGPFVFDGEMGEGWVRRCIFGVSVPMLTDPLGLKFGV
jgi:hypothetical protein